LGKARCDDSLFVQGFCFVDQRVGINTNFAAQAVTFGTTALGIDNEKTLASPTDGLPTREKSIPRKNFFPAV
jgi:hypothetical protein